VDSDRKQMATSLKGTKPESERPARRQPPANDRTAVLGHMHEAAVFTDPAVTLEAPEWSARMFDAPAL